MTLLLRSRNEYEVKLLSLENFKRVDINMKCFKKKA